MSKRAVAGSAYLAELMMTSSPFKMRSTWTVLSKSAFKKPSSMKINRTAKPTPETATASRRRSCVKFCQAKGVRALIVKSIVYHLVNSEQIGRIGLKSLAHRRQSRAYAHHHRQHEHHGPILPRHAHGNLRTADVTA